MIQMDSVLKGASRGMLMRALPNHANANGQANWRSSRRGFLLKNLGVLVLPNLAAAQDQKTSEDLPEPHAPPYQELAKSDGFSFYERDWVDIDRRRDVPVRVYLPKGMPVQGEGWPLIIFSHGIGGSRRGYSYLGSFLASQGFIALHVQHVGSDREVWFGNPFKMVHRLQMAAREKEAIDRVQDIRFALDQFLRGESGHFVDSRKIIAAGHSYGANTTMLLAGARIARNGEDLNFRDPRIKAAAIISAPPFYGEAELSAVLGGITIPTLHITATEDVISIPGYHSPAIDRIKVFEAIGGSVKVLAVFEGGSHSIFTDRAVTGGEALNPKVKQATREIVCEFASKIFKHDGQSLEDWHTKHRGLMAQWVIKRPNASGFEREQVSARKDEVTIT